MEYRDFPIQIGPRQESGYLLVVESSPAGEGRGLLHLPWSDEETAGLLQFCEDGLRSRAGRNLTVDFGPEVDPAGKARGPEPALEELGTRLFDALFTGEVRRLLDRSLGRFDDDPDRGLRIRLRFNVRDPDLALLTSLPWEFLCDRERRDFLSLRRKVSLVRSLDLPQPLPPAFKPPLRVVVVAANPLDFPALDLDLERRHLEAILSPLPGVEVTFLPRAEPGIVRETLLNQRAHVLHFMGHGFMTDESPEAALVFVDETGGALRLSAQGVARLLTDAGNLRLVVLNACDTARASRRSGLDPMTGVAAALAGVGLPAVVAMQFPMTDRAATAFSAAFYNRLSQGDPVDAAVVEGRQAILVDDPESQEWGTPVLFLRAEGDLVLMTGNKPSAAPTVAPPVRPGLRREILDYSRFIAERTDGFVGRDWVFAKIDRFTQECRRGYFLLQGDPGIGKSALLAWLVRQRGYIHHFNIQAEGIHRAGTFLENLCVQLICTYGLDWNQLPPEAGADVRFLKTLLEEVSRKLRPGEKAILLVDALDEAEPPVAGTNPLCLPVSLPEGIYLVATARRGQLGLRIECDQASFLLTHDAPENRADVRRFVEGKLRSPNMRAYLLEHGINDDTLIADLVFQSEGNFMYLRYVIPEIEEGAYRGTTPDNLPLGLENYYEDHWRRMRVRSEATWFEMQLPVLAALTVAETSISASLIADFTGLKHSQVAAVLEGWNAFLHTTPVPAAEVGLEKRYRFYHASFRDFIVAKDTVQAERLDLQKMHRRIGDLFLEDLFGR